VGPRGSGGGSVAAAAADPEIGHLAAQELA
jgi:hypothetical protein